MHAAHWVAKEIHCYLSRWQWHVTTLSGTSHTGWSWLPSPIFSTGKENGLLLTRDVVPWSSQYEKDFHLLNSIFFFLVLKIGRNTFLRYHLGFLYTVLSEIPNITSKTRSQDDTSWSFSPVQKYLWASWAISLLKLSCLAGVSKDTGSMPIDSQYALASCCWKEEQPIFQVAT